MKIPPAAAFAATLLLILLQTSCSRSPAPPEPSDALDIRIDYRGAEEPSKEFLEKYQPDLRVIAYQVDDGWFEARVMNRSDRRFAIDAGMFGVLFADGETRRIERNTARYQFPSIPLGPEELATGRFRFHKQKDLTGAYLIFKSPDPRVRPSRGDIGPRSPEDVAADNPKERKGISWWLRILLFWKSAP